MVHPYPADGPIEGPPKKRETIYNYTNNRRLVEIFAETQEEADQEFKDRFGFAPTEENNYA